MNPVPATVADQIRAQMGALSPAERKVGRAMLAGYPAAGLDTVARLADRAQVSAPTVVRFANRLGFSGFPELQEKLRAELEEREAFPLTRVAELRSRAPREGGAFSDAEGIVRYAESFAGGVTETLQSLPAREVEQTVALFCDSRLRITVMGGRFSRLLGHYLALHLMQLRPGVTLLPETAVERGAALQDIGRRDVLVVLDFRRYEPWSVNVARSAVGRGAKVVLLTDRWLSPAAESATTVLPATVDSISPYDSLVPALAIVEGLVGLVVDALGSGAERRLADIEELSQDLGLLQ